MKDVHRARERHAVTPGLRPLADRVNQLPGAGRSTSWPPDPDALQRADAIAVAPATFNTINKRAAGIGDTLALGILNEALGLGLPVVAAPYAKPPLASHPAFDHSVRFLRAAGVALLDTDAIRPAGESESFRWALVLDALRG